MHEGLWAQLEALDPEQTARRAGCRYEPDAKRFSIVFLNRQHIVEPTARRILEAYSAKTPGYLEQLSILAYLINATDKPLSGEWVSERSLPGGDFYFRTPVHQLPTSLLESAFGAAPEKLHRVKARFAAESAEFGDAAIRLLVLPRVPIAIVIWSADCEFPARARVMFDSTAAEQLPLDALGAAATVAIKAVARAAGGA